MTTGIAPSRVWDSFDGQGKIYLIGYRNVLHIRLMDYSNDLPRKAYGLVLMKALKLRSLKETFSHFTAMDAFIIIFLGRDGVGGGGLPRGFLLARFTAKCKTKPQPFSKCLVRN
jgi:hypothetical protein